MEIQVSNKTILIDEGDLPLFLSRRWHVASGYVVTRGRPGEPAKVSFHRALLGETGQEVDHINGNPLDNRRENLRLCSHAENMRNRKVHRHNRSGLKGVQVCRDRFRARITVAGKRLEIGSFADAEDAATAYREAAAHYFGPFARTN